MATSNRDVKLTLSVDTLGEDGIASLRAAVVQLAKDGGEAGPQFQQLVDQLDRLGAQGAALAQFQKLADETAELAREQSTAAQRVGELGERLAAARTNAADFAASQQQASEALRGAQTAVLEASGELAKLRSQYDTAGRSTDEYRTALAGLIDRQTAARTAALEARAALVESNKEYGTAERQLKTVEVAYARADKAARDVGQAFASSTSALQETAQAAEALGVSTTDVAGAQAVLSSSFAELATEAQQLQYWLDAGAQALRDQEAETKRAAQEQQAFLASLNAEIQLRQRLSAEREQAAAASRAATAAAQAEGQAQQEAAAAARAKSDADAEMAEHNRMLAIQQAAMNDLYRRGADALNAETAAIREAVQGANLYVAAKREQAEAERRAADEAQQAMRRIEDAFSTVGMRSAQDLQREINEVAAAMVTVQSHATATGARLAGAFAAGEARIGALQRELRELNGALTLGDRASRLFAGSLSQITAGNLIADGIGNLIGRAKELGTEFFSTNLEIQRLSRALTQVHGSSAAAAEQIAFLRRTANESGVSMGAMSDAFVRFSAATRSSGIDLATVNGVFAAVTRSAGVLGLTNDQVTGTLEALGQMASKGTVSMEELRQQLGDRLPGALSIAARGLGVTEERLTGMVEAGNLTARVFFPAFEQGLRETFGTGTARVEGFVQAWNRLKNAVAETAQQASNTSFFTTTGKVMDALASNIGGVVTALTTLVQAFVIVKAVNIGASFFAAGEAAALAAKAVATNTAALTVNAGAAATAAAANTRLASAFGIMAAGARSALTIIGGFPGAVALVVLNARELGTWIGESIAKFTSAGDALRRYEEATRKQVEADRLAAEQKRALQVEQDQLNLKNTEAATKATQAAEAAVTNAKKAIDAKNAEIAVSTTYAQIVGNEEAALRTAATAADERAAAQRELTASTSALVEATEGEIAAIERTRDASGKLTEKQGEQVTKLQELLTGRREELKETEANTRSLELERVQRQLTADLYRDNADRIKELAQAHENAKAKADVMTQSGVASADQLRIANAQAAASARLLADGYSDLAVRTKLKADAEQASTNATLARLGVEQGAYQQLAASARQMGDYAMAIYYEIEAKQIQIKVTELNAKAKRLEAEALEKAAIAERDALDKTKQLTEVKRLEIEARIANARAKATEAGASAAVIRALEAEIVNLRLGIDLKNRNADANDRNTNSRLKNAGAIDKQTDALQRQQRLTSDGLETNTDGSAKGTFNNAIPLDVANQIIAKLRGNSLSADDLSAAQSAMTQANNARQWMSEYQRQGGSVSVQGYQDMLSIYNGARAALEQVQELVQMRDAAGAAPATSSPTETTTAPTRTAAPSKVIRVQIQMPNGRAETVDTMNQASADAVLRVLQQFQSRASYS